MSKRWYATEMDGDWAVLKFIEADKSYKSYINDSIVPATTEELISAFKATKFFRDLINDKTIAIYVVGSRAIGLDKPRSDLDMIVIVDDQEIDSNGKSSDIRLSYRGLAVHWRLYSYKELFYINKTGEMLAIFRQQICYSKTIPVYLDDRGKKLNDYLIKNRRYLTKLGASLTAFSYKDKLSRYVNRSIKPLDLKKPMYHLAMASEILIGEVDIDFLSKIKSATYRDYKNLVGTGFIARLNYEIQKLIKESININYKELCYQTNAVNENICKIINS